MERKRRRSRMQTGVDTPAEVHPFRGRGDGRRTSRDSHTRLSLILASVTVAFLIVLAVIFRGGEGLVSGGYGAQQRGVQGRLPLPIESDFAEFSCGDILKETAVGQAEARCAFARTCNEGEGCLLPFVFCGAWNMTAATWSLFLSPFLLLWLVLLFQILGSTAEDFFSPSLEMFSRKLGLPARFAGVSLLALGNGAPDVSACVNSIIADPKEGYRLTLGSLTGAGMFTGTVVIGSIILVTDGVECGGALSRDVLVYAFAQLVVSAEFLTGSIGDRAIYFFFSIYIVYVVVVFATESNDKTVLASAIEREKVDILPQAEGVVEYGSTLSMPAKSVEASHPQQIPARHLSHLAGVLASFSTVAGTNVCLQDVEEESTFALNGPGGILHHRHEHRLEYINETGTSLFLAAREALLELKDDWDDLVGGILLDDSMRVMEKMLLGCELPFTVLRKLTIPIPVEGFFSQPLLALSLILSPVWLLFYLRTEFDIDIYSHARSFTVSASLLVLSGVCVLRYSDKVSLPLWAEIPTAIYGFAVAATWIDLVGAHLVRLLEFFGAVMRIPSIVMGLTVLAWGNSIGDLSINVAMARKGLANMGTTACFAGPCFTLCFGLGIGLGILAPSYKEKGIPVTLPPSAKAGFIFGVLNCFLFVLSGALNSGSIRKMHAYLAFILYALYLASCIAIGRDLGG